MPLHKILAKLTLSMATWGLMTASFAAQPVWTFIPLTPTTVIVPSNGSAVISYRVTNQSEKPHRLQWKPIPGITQIANGPGVCQSEFFLPNKGSSCVLVLTVKGSQLRETNFVGGPVVCEQGNSNQCYQPAQINLLNITKANAAAFYAYVANDFSTGDNRITRCESLPNGDLDSCVFVGTGFNNPFGLLFNNNKSRVYIANSFTQKISKCDLDINGYLVNCILSGTGLNNPTNIALNGANTRAYVTNADNNNVSKCDLNVSGDLVNCTITAINMGFPTDIVLNAAETLAYVANPTTDSISKCDVGTNGNLNNCTSTGTGFTNPIGITFNKVASKAYIVNGPILAIGHVSICDVAADGDLINCLASVTLGNTSRFLVFNEDESLAYITNAVSDNINKCEVIPGGDLINCTTTGSNMNGATGIQLLLR